MASDEVFLKINGRLHYLWRAVDQDGDVLDIMVQSRRDKKAARKFFRKLLKELCYVPRVIVTNKLRSYSAARTEVMPSVEHVQQKYQNNRAENSHQPTNAREGYARIQVSRTSAKISLSIRSHYFALQSWETSVPRSWLPSGDEIETRRMGTRQFVRDSYLLTCLQNLV